MTDTKKEKRKDFALSKNKGEGNVRYLKRLQQAKEAREEQDSALKEMIFPFPPENYSESNEEYPQDDNFGL